MPPLKEVSPERGPEDFLRAALEADTPDRRAAHAREGLRVLDAQDPEDLDADTQFLLLRQVYLAELEVHRFRAAADIAERMAEVGTMVDVARHDASRALLALDDRDGAIAQQRLAARAAPPQRRSFQWWALGALLHFGGDRVSAVAAFRRAERWAHDDRPLIVAHAAWVDLERGEPVEDLIEVIHELETSERASKGYGRLVLGMLCYQMGDHAKAAVHLRAWLRRNASLDAAKAISLREELRRARVVLAELESD